MLEGPWPSVDVRVVAIFVWLICSIMVPEQDNQHDEHEHGQQSVEGQLWLTVQL